MWTRDSRRERCGLVHDGFNADGATSRRWTDTTPGAATLTPLAFGVLRSERYRAWADEPAEVIW